MKTFLAMMVVCLGLTMSTQARASDLIEYTCTAKVGYTFRYSDGSWAKMRYLVEVYASIEAIDEHTAKTTAVSMTVEKARRMIRNFKGKNPYKIPEQARSAECRRISK